MQLPLPSQRFADLQRMFPLQRVPGRGREVILQLPSFVERTPTSSRHKLLLAGSVPLPQAKPQTPVGVVTGDTVVPLPTAPPMFSPQQ